MFLRFLIVSLLLLIQSQAFAMRYINFNYAGNTLRVPYGADWKVTTQAKDATQLVIRLVPLQENIKNWTQMITVQVILEAPGMTAEEYLHSIVPRMKALCAASQSNIYSRKSSPDKDTLMWFYCTKYSKTEMGEIILFKVLLGKKGLFIVQRSWRGKPYDLKDIPLGEGEKDQWVHFIEGIELK